MAALAQNFTRCAPSALATPVLFGAEILQVQANLVTGYNFPIPIPKGWTYSYPVPEVQNVTFCNVTVTYTHPGQNDTINVEAWLPTAEDWNGRLQAVGGGGWVAGRFGLTYAGMTGAVVDGYATATTDAGVSSVPASDPRDLLDWLLVSPGNLNLNALQNLGQTSLGDEAVITKQLIKSYYGKGPSYSYWNACSHGGRQGLKLAQQYPSAYDGIISAAPAVNWAEVFLGPVWPIFYMELTKQFPRGCELDALTSLAIDLCDGLDGNEDGLIADPEACRAAFNPFDHVGTVFACSDTNATMTISTAAAAVANATWSGPRFSNGDFLWYGFEIGSDLRALAPTSCNGFICVGSGTQSIAFAYQAFVDKNPEANITTSNLTHRDFDAIYRVVKQVFASNMETNERDLRDFRDAGGKIITFHGLADPAIPPGNSLHYYKDVTGFIPDTSSFYKYYRVPGLEHCFGGPGGQPESLFGQLRAWVEDGTEPAQSPVSITLPDKSTQQQILCPYPQKAVLVAGCDQGANSTSCWSCSAEADCV